MIITNKQLTQQLITTTANQVIYQPPTSTTVTYITMISVCNVDGTNRTYSMFVNQNSTTMTLTNALRRNYPIVANSAQETIYPEDAAIILRGSSAALAFACSAINAIAVTIYGKEVEES